MRVRRRCDSLKLNLSPRISSYKIDVHDEMRASRPNTHTKHNFNDFAGRALLARCSLSKIQNETELRSPLQSDYSLMTKRMRSVFGYKYTNTCVRNPYHHSSMQRLPEHTCVADCTQHNAYTYRTATMSAARQIMCRALRIRTPHEWSA